MGKDFKYQLRFLEINENSAEIKDVLRGKAWKQNAVWASSQQESEAEIYKAYTALPDAVPQRVYDLAHSIASSADNNYDKMSAFKSYLAGYTYTKAPPPCPKGDELTDWFLFESKQGYCTYFATAMAVLGRCEGIPTRYVEGFMTHDTCKGVPLQVTLTGENSHAWAEFYIDNIGWVRIDATPATVICKPLPTAGSLHKATAQHKPKSPV